MSAELITITMNEFKTLEAAKRYAQAIEQLPLCSDCHQVRMEAVSRAFPENKVYADCLEKQRKL